MTVECEGIIKTFGFDSEEYKTVEYMLTRASPARIISAIQRKGGGEDHPAEWYLPLFTHNFIKSSYAFDCSFDDQFWQTYQIFDSICELHTFDLPYIDQMRVSIARVKRAIRNSKVKNVRYIFRVWQDTQEEVVVNNADKIQQVFKSNVARVVNL